MSNITRNTTLPDSSEKADFHNLIDTATVQALQPATNSTTALKLANAAGTAILNVDTTNSRVGIGTTSPASTCDVTGTLTVNDSSNAILLTVANDGTGSGVFIDQNGNGIALNIDSEATTTNVVTIDNAGTGTGIVITQVGNGSGIDIANGGTANGMVINQNGTSAVTKYGLWVRSATAQTNTPLAYFQSTHNDTTTPVVSVGAVTNDASDPAVGVEINADNAGAGNQIALDINHVDEAKSYLLRVNATTAWTSSKSPEIDAEAGWLKIMVGTTAYFVPYYAAS